MRLDFVGLGGHGRGASGTLSKEEVTEMFEHWLRVLSLLP